jgi:aminoglycoside phosphotransferase (APT) family kinase protein
VAATETSLVEVVSSHYERAVVRVGDVFVKVETDPERAAREIDALASVDVVAVPRVLWSHDGPPHVMALSSMTGTQLATLGQPSAFGYDAWRAAGTLLRSLHASREPSDGDSAEALRAVRLMPQNLELIERWLADNRYGDRARVATLAARASKAFASWQPATGFLHGDMQAAHIFIGDDNEVVGVIDWADSAFGDPLADISVLTVGHPEFLDAVIDGYGSPVDRSVVAAYQTVRRLWSVRWMVEHGYDAAGDIAALDFLYVQTG